MIERVVVDGRAGSACYLDSRFMPVDEARATFLKIVFDDGGQLTLAVPTVPGQPKPEPPPPKVLDPKKRIAWADARARSAVLLQRWDESQHPREPAGGPGGGQFTSGGGGEGGAADPTSANSLRKPEDVTPDKVVDLVPGAREHVDSARAMLAKTVHTDAPVSKGGYKQPDGMWTPAREALHDKIVSKVFTPEAIAAATPKPGEQPVLHLLGGRGGSGKSWFTGLDGTIEDGPLYLNNDNFKAELPEYRGWNAPQVHEESSAVGDVAEELARDYGLNVIIDGTMRDGSKLKDRIDAYKKAGYRIEGHYMYTSPAKATQRALERFTRGMEKNGQGRFVAPEYSLGSTSNEKSFDDARPLMDKWEIYDNNVDGRAPKFHSRSK